jgi:hypothetical protein
MYDCRNVAERYIIFHITPLYAISHPEIIPSARNGDQADGNTVCDRNPGSVYINRIRLD